MILSLENVVAGLILVIVFYFSIQMVIRRMVIRRIRVERELVDIISSKLTMECYKNLNDIELKKYILKESKDLMDMKDYTMATFPFNHDSIYGQTMYMKQFREHLEKSLSED